MAKYGEVSTQLINIRCPYCYEFCETERGSMDFMIGDDTQWDAEAMVRFVICHCGKRVNIGRTVRI